MKRISILRQAFNFALIPIFEYIYSYEVKHINSLNLYFIKEYL